MSYEIGDVQIHEYDGKTALVEVTVYLPGGEHVLARMHYNHKRGTLLTDDDCDVWAEPIARLLEDDDQALEDVSEAFLEHRDSLTDRDVAEGRKNMTFDAIGNRVYN